MWGHVTGSDVIQNGGHCSSHPVFSLLSAHGDCISYMYGMSCTCVLYMYIIYECHHWHICIPYMYVIHDIHVCQNIYVKHVCHVVVECLSMSCMCVMDVMHICHACKSSMYFMHVFLCMYVIHGPHTCISCMHILHVCYACMSYMFIIQRRIYSW